jgi:hypothetical protein
MKTRTLFFTNWALYKQTAERFQKLYGAIVRKLSTNGSVIKATFYYN